MSCDTKNCLKSIFLMVFLFTVSSFYVYLASFSTSPLYPSYYGGDSAQFQTIGKAWLSGRIPYIRMFDHKGPLIFWIDMLGYMITGTSTGIMIIQIVFMVITLFFVFKISQLVSKSVIYGGIVVLLSLIVLTTGYGDGNLVEEYCLPFLAMCTYFQVKYLSVNEREHSPKLAAVYGGAVAVCFLTRITNAVTVGVGVLIISILLIKESRWKNLFDNALGFLGGFAVVLFPFFLYFGFHGVIGDFIYCTLGYNIEYQTHMSSWVRNAGVASWKFFMVHYLSAYSIFLTAFLLLCRKKYSLLFYCILCGVFEMCLFLSGALFIQYAIIALPQFAILANEVIMIERKKASIFAMLAKGVLIVCIIIYCCNCFSTFVSCSVGIYNRYKSFKPVGYETLLEEIPTEDRDSFVAYGDNRFKELYLLHDLLPCYKYFVIQEWHSSFSDFVKKDIHDTFSTGYAKWIITAGSTENIKDILNDQYKLVNQTEDYCLYTKK